MSCQVIESSLNADIPPVDEHQSSTNDRQRSMPTETEWRMYARDLQDTKEDLYFIDSLVHRGISKVCTIYFVFLSFLKESINNKNDLLFFLFIKIDRLVTFTNLYT